MSKKSRRRFTRFMSFGCDRATSELVRRYLLLGAKDLLGAYFSDDSRVCEAAGEYSAGAGGQVPVSFFVESAHVSGLAELPSAIGIRAMRIGAAPILHCCVGGRGRELRPQSASSSDVGMPPRAGLVAPTRQQAFDRSVTASQARVDRLALQRQHREYAFVHLPVRRPRDEPSWASGKNTIARPNPQSNSCTRSRCFITARNRCFNPTFRLPPRRGAQKMPAAASVMRVFRACPVLDSRLLGGSPPINSTISWRPEFPGRREKCREFRRISLLLRKSVSKTSANSAI
jgi:hypothetical protein